LGMELWGECDPLRDALGVGARCPGTQRISLFSNAKAKHPARPSIEAAL
jgi:hypothetical protein